MYQLPVNNLTRIRRARKRVKWALEDIGLEYCRAAAEEFKEFCPDEQLVKDTLCFDICTWDPSHSKTQEYRSKPFCCSECPFSSKYYSGYKNHFRTVHRKLLDGKILLNCPYCAFTADQRTLEAHVKIFHVPSSRQQLYGNLGGNVLHRVEKAMYFCKKCSFRDSLYNVVRRHIYREHFHHIVSPYVVVVSKLVKNSTCPVNSNNIYCKQCQFSTRTYEALVQHVLEYHERIGSHVTNMIGHANVLISTSQPLPLMNQFISRNNTPRSDPVSQPVMGYLKPAAPLVKNQSSIQTSQMPAKPLVSSPVPENKPTVVNTAQTQKWKICTVCNELFPENLYSAHFESAHKARKVWAHAKYIMKIHNFTSKCLLCNRYLPSSTLLNHMLIHGLTCPQCHSAFHSVEKIMEHTAQAHPDEFVGPAGASPVTFDLTIKQGSPRNIQLAVLPFNMKESYSSPDQSVLAPQNVPRPDSWSHAKVVKRHVEPKALVSLIHSSEDGKTACPLCFTLLKGPISDALAMHLRERHQVLQTMHPVEKKMTYKCIHCLGVYTSNMVASTITLHLVQCRAVGRSQVSGDFKSNLIPESSGVVGFKRQLPPQAISNPKRIKMNKDDIALACRNNCKFDGLVLDPTAHKHRTYEAKKGFLTTYFNQRPYPTPEEEEKLAASLSIWRSEVASHFASKRNICMRSCKMNKLLVQVDFDMSAVKKLKHHLVFLKDRLVGTSKVRSAGIKTLTHTKEQKACGTPSNTFELSTCPVTISIDSDSEEEMAKTAADNVKSENQVNLNEENKHMDSVSKVSVEETRKLPAEDVESKEEKLSEDTEHVDTESSSVSIDSDSEGKKEKPATNAESQDREDLTEETKNLEMSDLSRVFIDSDSEEQTRKPLADNLESKDRGDSTEETKNLEINALSKVSISSDSEEETVKLPAENVESKEENLVDETEHLDTKSSSVSIESDSEEEMAKTAADNLKSKNQVNLNEENKHMDIESKVSVEETRKLPAEDVESKEEKLSEDTEHVDTESSSVSIESDSEEETEKPPAENVESKDREDSTEETENLEMSDPSNVFIESDSKEEMEKPPAENVETNDSTHFSIESNFLEIGKQAAQTVECMKDPDNLTEETEHLDVNDPTRAKSSF